MKVNDRPSVSPLVQALLCFALCVTPLAVQAQTRESNGAELLREQRRDRDEKEQKRIDACASTINQRTAALIAEDWPALERLAAKSLKDCKGVEDDLDLAEAYVEMALARTELGKYADALKAAQSCKQLHFANAGCHLSEAQALEGLNRIVECRAAYTAALRIARAGVQSSKREARFSSDPHERGKSEATIHRLTAYSQLAEAKLFSLQADGK